MDKRIGAVARAVGYRATCEACALSDELQRRSEELRISLGLPDAPDAPRFQMRSMCCGREQTIRAAGFTPADCEKFQRWETLYWRGEVCSPECVTLTDWLNRKLEDAQREQYGEHAPAFAALYADYRADAEGVRQAPIPYLCRVPDCFCAYPKTLEEWRANARRNGLDVPA